MCKALFCILCAVTFSQGADVFLSRGEKEDLLIELENSFGSNIITSRMQRLKELMGPMYKSLPKRSDELISPAVGRYALQRIMTGLHGWTMQGAVSSTVSSSTVETLRAFLHEVIPPHVFAMFSTHVREDAMSFDEVAIVAALIEHFAHEDQKHIARQVMEAFNLPTSGPVDMVDVQSVLKIYVSVFLRYNNIPELHTFKNVEEALEEANYRFPGWPATATFIEDQVATLRFYLEQGKINPFKQYRPTMQLAFSAVELIADRMPSQIAAAQCEEMQDDLISIEQGSSGRVRLADFYQKTLSARFFYIETKEYLQAVGALDDTDLLLGPKVMIPNYLHMPSNCMAYNHMYSICCKNECEEVMGHLEQELVAPSVQPARILSLVSSFSTRSVQAPRNLTNALTARLYDISSSQGGRVILHSRLFSLWMHQAFPRECPYPHLAGTTSLLHTSRWTELTGTRSRIDFDGRKNRPKRIAENVQLLEQMYPTNSSSFANLNTNSADDLQWVAEDEHFLEGPRTSLSRIFFRLIAMACCFIMFAPIVSLLQGKMRVAGGKETGQPCGSIFV